MQYATSGQNVLHENLNTLLKIKLSIHFKYHTKMYIYTFSYCIHHISQLLCQTQVVKNTSSKNQTCSSSGTHLTNSPLTKHACKLKTNTNAVNNRNTDTHSTTGRNKNICQYTYINDHHEIRKKCNKYVIITSVIE